MDNRELVEFALNNGSEPSGVEIGSISKVVDATSIGVEQVTAVTDYIVVTGGHGIEGVMHKSVQASHKPFHLDNDFPYQWKDLTNKASQPKNDVFLNSTTYEVPVKDASKGQCVGVVANATAEMRKEILVPDATFLTSDSSQGEWTEVKGKKNINCKKGSPKTNPFMVYSDFTSESRFPVNRTKENSPRKSVISNIPLGCREKGNVSKNLAKSIVEKVILEEDASEDKDCTDKDFERFSSIKEKALKRTNRELVRLQCDSMKGIGKEKLGRGQRSQNRKVRIGLVFVC